MTKVAVLGAGSWGTTYAKILVDGGSDVSLWARRPELAEEINNRQHNSQYLPGLALPEKLTATSDLSAALEGAEQIYLAVPSQSLRAVLKTIQPELTGEQILISLMKGVEKNSGLRMSQVIQEELNYPEELIAVVSGPNLAREIAAEEPTAAVVASSSKTTAQCVAMCSRNNYFHTFTNQDVIGTEYGGVLKNLIAVAVGIADGVGYGDNTTSSIITRGLAEITEFAVSNGAETQTMYGLAGLGDLIATCSSPLSRNNQAGRLLGRGLDYQQVVEQMEQTAEGLSSVSAILAQAQENGVDMPIVHQVGRVIAGEMNPREIAPYLASEDGEPVEEFSTPGSSS